MEERLVHFHYIDYVITISRTNHGSEFNGFFLRFRSPSFSTNHISTTIVSPVVLLLCHERRWGY